MNCCSTVTYIPDILVNLTILDCSYCSLLTHIPNTLVNLIHLYCRDCLIKEIPDTLINLKYLDCWACSRITSIPITLKKLKVLFCCYSICYIPFKIRQQTTLQPNIYTYFGLYRIKLKNKLKRIRVKLLLKQMNENKLLSDINVIILTYAGLSLKNDFLNFNRRQ